MPRSLKMLSLIAAIVILGTASLAADEKPKGEEKPREKAKPAEAIQKGVAYLVKVQGKDGGWGKGETMSQIVPAITALSLMALDVTADQAAEGDRDKVKKAAAKGRELVDKAAITTGLVKIYDHQPRNWDNATRLYFYLRIPKDKRTKDDDAKLKTLIEALESSQERLGGWTYLCNWQPSMEKSTTFLSSFVLLALLEAKHQGCKVTDDTIAKGVEFFKKLRNEDGTFKYYYRAAKSPSESKIGSSARNVGAELALFMAGESDQKKLQWAIGNFFQHRNELEKVRGGKKPQGIGTSHWGKDNIAHYFFYYSHFFTIQALDFVDKDAKIAVDADDKDKTMSPAECRAAVRAILIETQRADGSWGVVSNPDTHYDTALALFGLSEKKLLTCPPLKTPIKLEKKEPEKDQKKDTPGKDQ